MVYCHIFPHNFILYKVIFMFYIFWGFSNDLPYFGYNSEEQEIPTLCIFFFTFRDLYGSNRTRHFSRINILRRRTFCSLGTLQTEIRREQEPRWCEAHLWLCHLGSFPPRSPQPSIQRSTWWSWPKNAYIKVPQSISKRSRSVIQKPQNRIRTSEDWRGNLCRSHRQWDLNPLQDQHQQH
jgi:hypothetical protein